MTFNEQNTIENAIRDLLCGKANKAGKIQGLQVNEDLVAYNSTAIPDSPQPFFSPWKFGRGGGKPRLLPYKIQTKKMLTDKPQIFMLGYFVEVMFWKSSI